MPCESNLWKYEEDEAEEIKARPIGDCSVDYTKNQIKFRKNIAERMCKYLLRFTGEFSPAYRFRPMWKFYVGKDNIPRRVYGMGIQNGIYTAYTSMASAISYDPLISLNDLVEVKEWTEEHLELIKNTDSPGTFIDPLGFVPLIETHYSSPSL